MKTNLETFPKVELCDDCAAKLKEIYDWVEAHKKELLQRKRDNYKKINHPEVAIRVGYLARIDLIDELLGKLWLPDKKKGRPE